MIKEQVQSYKYIKVKNSKGEFETTFLKRYSLSDIFPMFMKLGFLGIIFVFVYESHMTLFFFGLTVIVFIGSELSRRTLLIKPIFRIVAPGSSLFGYRWDQSSVKWPLGYLLRYETKVNTNGKIEEITLIAQSEDRRSTIPLFSFPSKEVFEEFQTEYNSAFPDHKIQN